MDDLLARWLSLNNRTFGALDYMIIGSDYQHLDAEKRKDEKDRRKQGRIFASEMRRNQKRKSQGSASYGLQSPPASASPKVQPKTYHAVTLNWNKEKDS